MKVRFAEIPAEGLRFDIHDESWFPDRELQRTGPVHAAISLKHSGGERVLVEGTIQTTLSFDCDRCLETYSLDIDSSFSLDAEYVSPGKHVAAEHEISSSEMDMVYLNEPVLDIFAILSQQVYLMVPEKHLCLESCRGLCSRCGTNLNEESCRCSEEPKSSPFSVLKNI